MQELYKAYRIKDGKRVRVADHVFVTFEGKMYYKSPSNGLYGTYKYKNCNNQGRPMICICNKDSILVEEIMFATFMCKTQKEVKKYANGTLRIIYKDGNRANLDFNNLEKTDFLNYAKWAKRHDIYITHVSDQAYKLIYNIMDFNGLSIRQMVEIYNLPEPLIRKASKICRV